MHTIVYCVFIETYFKILVLISVVTMCLVFVISTREPDAGGLMLTEKALKDVKLPLTVTRMKERLNEPPILDTVHSNQSNRREQPVQNENASVKQYVPSKAIVHVEDKFNSLPLHDIVYKNESRLNSDRAVFVVPRIAYYDRRLVKDTQRNKVLIIAEIHYEALNTIKACELNGHVSKSVSVLKDDDEKRSGDFTHCYVIVECEGFANTIVIEESTTKLIYKIEGEPFYSRVMTEKPLLLTYADPPQGRLSVVVCSALVGHPERFKDWLKYQDVLAVNFIHLNVDPSFYENATKLYPFLDASLENHFVEMEVWNNIVGDRIPNAGQLWKYQDCLLRYLGIFEYGMFVKVDEFFTPVDPKQKYIHYYINRGFSTKKKKVVIGSASFLVRQMLCLPNPERYKTLRNGNVTSVLSGYKSIVRPEKITVYRIDNVLIRNFPGFISAKASPKIAYFAQNKVTEAYC